MNQYEQFKCPEKAGVIMFKDNTNEKSVDYDANENISENLR